MRGIYLLKSIYSAESALISYFPRLRRCRYRDGRFVVLSAMPKSGSTFLSLALEKALGYRHSYVAFAFHNVEQELYVPKILDTYGHGTVVQQHFKANKPNLAILDRFGIRPVVLIRNIFDALVSARDHLLRERLGNLPGLYPHNLFRELTAEQQLDFITMFYAPWYITFYTSWTEAQQRGRSDFMWLRYEDCINDWRAALRAVIAHVGLRVSDEAITRALTDARSASNTRINKGVAGRGMALLTAEQQKMIARMAECYPDVDFSPLGIC